MKKIVNKLHFLIILAIIASLQSCKNNIKSDAVTGATKVKATKQLILPIKSKTYEVIGVKDGLNGFVVKYNDELYRGGEPCSAKCAKSLKSLGIQTIISVTPSERERKIAKLNNYKLFELPFTKDRGLTKEDLVKLVKIYKNEKKPIYIHCKGGSHRGGILGVAYRIHISNWTWEQAILEYGYLGGNLKDDQKMLESIKPNKN